MQKVNNNIKNDNYKEEKTHPLISGLTGPPQVQDERRVSKVKNHKSGPPKLSPCPPNYPNHHYSYGFPVVHHDYTSIIEHYI